MHEYEHKNTYKHIHEGSIKNNEFELEKKKRQKHNQSVNLQDN